MAIANAPATNGRQPLAAPARDNRPLVLVVDDEESYRQALASGLTREGFAVEAAGDGHEALRLFHRVHPDLVLLDVMLPGASGLTVLEQVRRGSRSRDIPVLVISAFSAESDQRAARSAGASGFLKKPFDPEELKLLVEDLLGARG